MKKKYIEILKQIQEEVPADLKKNIMKTVKPYEFMIELMKKAIEDDEFPEEKKQMYRNLIATRELEVEQEEVDEDITKKIDEFVDNRIREEIEKKNLPKYAFTRLFKKAKKHGKNIPTDGHITEESNS